MKVDDSLKAVTNTTCHCSVFNWDSNMQVVRKGNGDITMTEGELVKFFGVIWSKLNHRLQALMRFSNLHPGERSAGEGGIYVNEQLKDYAPLHPFPVIITLSFQLGSTEAYLFRKYLCERSQKPASVITPIFLLDSTDN